MIMDYDFLKPIGGNTNLHQAILDNDATAVRNIINSYNPALVNIASAVNTLNDAELSPLHLAHLMKNKEISTLLINNGANIAYNYADAESIINHLTSQSGVPAEHRPTHIGESLKHAGADVLSAGADVLSAGAAGIVHGAEAVVTGIGQAALEVGHAALKAGHNVRIKLKDIIHTPKDFVTYVSDHLSTKDLEKLTIEQYVNNEGKVREKVIGHSDHDITDNSHDIQHDQGGLLGDLAKSGDDKIRITIRMNEKDHSIFEMKMSGKLNGYKCDIERSNFSNDEYKGFIDNNTHHIDFPGLAQHFAAEKCVPSYAARHSSSTDDSSVELMGGDSSSSGTHPDVGVKTEL
jgi:hypothetical protein